MLGWASQQFEKLSQTVAPPPTDANGRFVYALQKGDEDGAMACIAEMDAARAVLNPTKRSYAIHLACQHSMDRLIRLLLTQPGVDLTFIDTHGNTPLHYATMSPEKGRALTTIKMLVTEFKASVVAKNSSGQTPYDLACLDSIKQFLLPLQLQEETRIAIDNGGIGLPPGIDMGGLRIANPAAPPPPIMPVAPAPMSSPPPHAYPTPAHDTPRPPMSGDSGAYALSGGSSAAIYKPTGNRYVKADGFHSSSSDVSLQRKYGHVQTQYGNVAPPPISGNAAAAAFPPPAASGSNPFAGGNNPYASGRANQRYVAYDAVTGQTTSAPRTAAPLPVYGHPAAVNPAANLSVFSPSGSSTTAKVYNPAASDPIPAQVPNGTPHRAYPTSQPHHTLAPQDTAASFQQQGYNAGSQQTQQQQYQTHGTSYGIQNLGSGHQSHPYQHQPTTPSGVAPTAAVGVCPSSGGLSTVKAESNVAASLFSPPPSGGVGMSQAPTQAAVDLFASPPSRAQMQVGSSPAGNQPALTQTANDVPPANHFAVQAGAIGASPQIQPTPAATALNVFCAPRGYQQLVGAPSASQETAQVIISHVASQPAATTGCVFPPSNDASAGFRAPQGGQLVPPRSTVSSTVGGASASPSGEPANNFLSAPPNSEATRNTFAVPVCNNSSAGPLSSLSGSTRVSQSTSNQSADGVFGALPAQATNDVVGTPSAEVVPVAVNTSAQTVGGAPIPVAPTSGGFSLADQAANSESATELFSSPSKSQLAALADTGSSAELNASTQPVDRAGSPSGSDEGLDDVPLSPDAQSRPTTSLAQSGTVAATNEPEPAFPPPPEHDLYAAIGMPPPPFSAKK